MTVATALRVLAMEIYAAVSKAQYAAAMLALAIQQLRAGSVTLDPDTIGASRTDLRDAHTMLVEHVPRRVAELDPDAPKNLRDMRGASVRLLERLLDQMPDSISDDQLTQHLHDRGVDTALLVGEISETFGQYLAEMQLRVITTSQQRARINESTIGDLLNQLSNMGTSIELIAINAAIEAARTGPAGAGFAVIAQEVQSLSGQMGSVVSAAQEELRGL